MGRWSVYLVKYYITITMWMFHRPRVHRNRTSHWEPLWNMCTRSTGNETKNWHWKMARTRYPLKRYEHTIDIRSVTKATLGVPPSSSLFGFRSFPISLCRSNGRLSRAGQGRRWRQRGCQHPLGSHRRQRQRKKQLRQIRWHWRSQSEHDRA
jgi:hypothetical protein